VYRTHCNTRSPSVQYTHIRVPHISLPSRLCQSVGKLPADLLLRGIPGPNDQVGVGPVGKPRLGKEEDLSLALAQPAGPV